MITNNYNKNKLHYLYNELLKKNLALDLTRGKPSVNQLSLSNTLLTNINLNDISNNSIDYRNYTPPNLFTGLIELKKIFSKILNVPYNQIIIGGNSSLNLMYDVLTKCFFHALPGQKNNWITDKQPIKFLCPVPGYDRHFSICESLNIDMIPVPLTGHGPDMDIVENLVKHDSSIKGIWCVPKYSNPTGEIYSNEVVERLAKMKTAYASFKIFWDNAYFMHDLNFDKDNKLQTDILNICTECERYDNTDRPFMFISTSKMTYAGGGVSAILSSINNVSWMEKHFKIQTIGYDKINQLRHIKFFNTNNIVNHMSKHAQIINPKFEAVHQTLSQELGNDSKFATWTRPKGGYFINFKTMKMGIAKKIVNMASKIGVKFTKAGSTFPYNNDPTDSNIRLAPTYPSIKEVKTACTVLSLITKILSI